MGQGYSSTTQYGQSGGTACGPTCEIWCLVEEPGVQQSFTRRVMSDPGGVQRHRVPAKYQTITKQVVADPGGVREVSVPGEYRTVTVEDMVDPGGAFSENVPPKYGNVQAKVIAETERYEWRRVVCKPGTGTMRSSYSHGSSYSAPAATYSSGGTYSSGAASHSGGSHMNHQHGADHYSSQPHSGSVHSGHSHSNSERFNELGSSQSGGTYRSGTTGYIDAYPFRGARQNSTHQGVSHYGSELAGGQRHTRKRQSYYR
jgi:hypothetical protein